MATLPLISQDISPDKRHAAFKLTSSSSSVLWKLALCAALGILLAIGCAVTWYVCKPSNFAGSSLPLLSFSNPGSFDNRLHGLVHTNQWRSSIKQQEHRQQDIPKTLYVSVADKDHVGAGTASSIDACGSINAGYKVEIMGEAERTSTIETHTPLLMPVYKKLKPTEKNDFWSYLMLYLFGGWYIDHDVQCFKPLDEFKTSFNNTAKAIIGLEAVLPEDNRNAIGFCCPVQYCHWVMGSAPLHPLFGHVVDLMLDVQAIAEADPGSTPGKQIDNPVMTTGPGILTKAVEHFMALHDVYPVDVALEKPEMVFDLGVMPRSAVAVGGYGTDAASADNSLIFVKHMFAGTWKHGNSGS